MSDVTLTPNPSSLHGSTPADVHVDGFVILWSRGEPDRVGEVALVPGEHSGPGWILGRAQPSGPPRRDLLQFYRQRPGQLEPRGAFANPHVSREQLRLRPGSGAVLVENLGRAPLSINGVPCTSGESRPGDVLDIEGLVLLLHVRRPLQFPETFTGSPPLFGLADRDGLVGESPALWALRAQIAFHARSRNHVIIIGPSGSGKELVAGAIHHHSAAAGRAFVSRNAATFPETLIDAELFGNARNFPNPGMADRPGLVGEADGGTLFLDEIGELSHALQAHLLRVLDRGEYQRLGESTRRSASFRLIAATNRAPTSLKEDFLARFPARLLVPDLNARREDIPLLARNLLRRAAESSPELALRFFEGGRIDGTPLIRAAFIFQLVRHTWTTHVRELNALLWESLSNSAGNQLEPLPSDHPGLAPPGAPPTDLEPFSFSAAGPPWQAAPRNALATGGRGSSGAPGPRFTDPRTVTREQLEAVIERHGGRQDAVCQDLGLASRFVLYRLMKKYGLKGAEQP